MWITKYKSVDNGVNTEYKSGIKRGGDKNQSLLLEVMHSTNLKSSQRTAQNMGLKDIHISTGLIVLTSIYI
ncbi:MAG: hypothetical protein AB200_02275 [Parcubacteria bacterium C7867-005]|nr:MAG: hypothetical protein AB200_02275 [Parcubacteria bacterium C7867-005]